MFKFFLSILLLTQTPDTTPPVITWEPEKPGWGDTVTLTYHHDAPGAVIKGQIPLYANILGGEVFVFENEGNTSRTSFVAPDSVSSVQFFIYSMEDLDFYASPEISFTTPEGWSSVKERFDQIKRTFMSASMGYYPKDSALSLLESLRAHPVDDPYYYYVCIDGFMKLDKSDSGWALLAYMRKVYPGTDAYTSSLNGVDYDVYGNAGILTNERKDTLYAWIDEDLKKAGSIPLLSSSITRWISDSTRLSLKERERIIKRFMEKKPFEPLLHSFLAMLYSRSGDTLSAIGEYSEAIEIALKGEGAKRAGGANIDSEGRMRRLEQWMLERGRLYAGTGEYDKALSDFSFVILQKDGCEADAYFERAKVWQRLERYKRAQSSFLKAYCSGNVDAVPALEGLYLFTTGSRDGFEEWLGEAMASQKENLFQTTDFGFKDLEGNAGRWFDYRGKIVVVNVWGLGCGPCKKEIPDLNKLVEEYKEKGVVFLAFTSNQPEALKRYFADHPFDYTNLVVEDERAISKSFRLPGSIPWHGIIDPLGQVRYRRLGAAEDNSDLELIIDQLLREQAQGK